VWPQCENAPYNFRSITSFTLYGGDTVSANTKYYGHFGVNRVTGGRGAAAGTLSSIGHSSCVPYRYVKFTATAMTYNEQQSWSGNCANQGNTCHFSGTKYVKYQGCGRAAAPAQYTSAVGCNDGVFGDPAHGCGKYCTYSTGMGDGYYGVEEIEFMGSSPSSTAALSSVTTTSSLSLSPSFHGGTTSYTVTAPSTMASLSLYPSCSDCYQIKVDNVVVSSGSGSTAKALAEGTDNNGGTTSYSVQVWAEDGTATRTYSITVHRLPSPDATLSSIGVSSGSYSPSYSRTTTSYTLNVANSVASVTLTPNRNHHLASEMRYDSGSGTYSSQTTGQATASIPLLPGATSTVRFEVTAQDGSTVLTYTIAIFRAAHTDKDLDSLSFNLGSGSSRPLHPFYRVSDITSSVFAPSITGYYVNIGHEETTATVSVSAYYDNANYVSSAHLPAGTVYTSNGGQEQKAVIRVNDNTVLTGAGSGTTSAIATSSQISLSATTSPSNVINIVVTAQDGNSKTYTLTIYRIGLTAISSSGGLAFSPTLSLPVLSYDITAPNGLATASITPTVTGVAGTYTIETKSERPQGGGMVYDDWHAASNNVASQAYSLSEGNTTIFDMKVTDARNSSNYRVYQFRFFRQPSTEVRLASIGPSTGQEVPAFSPSHQAYTIAIPNNVNSLTLHPTMYHYVCCANLEGIYFDGGDGTWQNRTYSNWTVSTTGTIPLIEGGATVVRFKIVAQDKISQLIYTITINRAQNTDRLLHNFVVNVGNGFMPVTAPYPVFSQATTDYAIQIAGNQTELWVTTTAYNSANAHGPSLPATDAYGNDVPASPGRSYTSQSARSIITVNGNEAFTGNTTKLPLVDGQQSPYTVTTIVVTAQDGTTTTYTLTVARLGITTFSTGSVHQTSGRRRVTNANTVANALVFNPTFHLLNLQYTITAPNSVAHVQFTPTGATLPSGFSSVSSFRVQVKASTPLQGNLPVETAYSTVASGATSNTYALSEGNITNFDLLVTNLHNASVTRQYGVSIFREPSPDDTLESLVTSEGSLVPAFSETQNDYTIALPNDKSSLILTPTMSHYVCCNSLEDLEFDPGSLSSLTVAQGNWAGQSSGSQTPVIPLVEGGVTIVRFRVTAQNSTNVRIYTITITRAMSVDKTLHSLDVKIGYQIGFGGEMRTKALTPSFSANQLTYTVTVPNHETDLVITPTAYNSPTGRGVGLPTTNFWGGDIALAPGRTWTVNSARASMLVNGTNILNSTGDLKLVPCFGSVDTNTIVPIVIEAQNGAKQTYVVTIKRLATVVPTPAPTKLAGNNTSDRMDAEVTLTGILASQLSNPILLSTTPQEIQNNATLYPGMKWIAMFKQTLLRGGLNIYNHKTCGGAGRWLNSTTGVWTSYKRYCEMTDIDVRVIGQDGPTGPTFYNRRLLGTTARRTAPINSSLVNTTTLQFSVQVADDVEELAIVDMKNYLLGTAVPTHGHHCTAISCTKTGNFGQDLIVEGMPITGYRMDGFSSDAYPNICAFGCDFPHRIVQQDFWIEVEIPLYAGVNKTSAEMGYGIALGIVSYEGVFRAGCSITSSVSPYDSRRTTPAPPAALPVPMASVTFIATIASGTPSKLVTKDSLNAAFVFAYDVSSNNANKPNVYRAYNAKTTEVINDDSGLTGWEIAGIVIACVVIVALILGPFAKSPSQTSDKDGMELDSHVPTAVISDVNEDGSSTHKNPIADASEVPLEVSKVEPGIPTVDADEDESEV